MAIAHVQSVGKITTGATSTTQAMTFTSGNFVVTAQAGFAGGGLSAAPTTPTDTLSQTYVGARAAWAPVNQSNQMRFFYVKNLSSGGADTVTMGQANTGDFTIDITEWSGGDATDPLGAAGEQNESNATSSTPTAGTTGTRAQADEMIIAMVSHTGNNTTITEDSGDSFSLSYENEGGTSNMPLGVQYKIVSNTTAITPDWTLGASRAWFAQEVTFNAAGAAATGYTPGVDGMDFRHLVERRKHLKVRKGGRWKTGPPKRLERVA